MNEGCVKPSSRDEEMTESDTVEEVVNLGNDIEKNVSLSADNIEPSTDSSELLDAPSNDGEPIETYDNNAQADTIVAMQYLATECAANSKTDGFEIEVTDVSTLKTMLAIIKYFRISDLETDDSYIVFQYDDGIYYRPTAEFERIMKEIADRVPNRTLDSLKCDYKDSRTELDKVSIENRHDALFIVNSIFLSITGNSYESDDIINGAVNENCKIRKHNKLGTDGLKKNSLAYHEAKYGTSEDNAFKQEIEDKQKQDGTVGALDQQQQESVQEPQFKRILPNVHNQASLTESLDVNIDALLEAKKGDILYEPNDHIIYVVDKKTKLQGRVLNVLDNVDGGQIINIMVQGKTYMVTANELEPDMGYISQRAMGMTTEENPATSGSRFLDINHETLLPNKVSNEKIDDKDYADLNDLTIGCNIVVDGHKFNYVPYKAKLKDIFESKKYIRVINEAEREDVWPVENVQFDAEDWPYAVLVNADDEENDDNPVRKVRINPTSFVNATDEDYVECLLADKPTQIQKKYIKMIVS